MTSPPPSHAPFVPMAPAVGMPVVNTGTAAAPPPNFGTTAATSTALPVADGMHQRRVSSNPPTVMASALPSHVRNRSAGSDPQLGATSTASSLTLGANDPNMMRQHSQGIGISLNDSQSGGVGAAGGNNFLNMPQSPAVAGASVSSSSSQGGGSAFDGQMIGGTTSSSSPVQLNEDGEPPLLEELGIRPDHIRDKVKLVLNPFSAVTASHELCMDEDLAGPLAFALCLGFLLTLQGKIHFGAIYGMSVCGIMLSYFILSMMSQDVPVRVSLVVSTLGYCLLPDIVLALFATGHLWIFGRGAGVLLTVFCFVTVAWSAWCAMKIFCEAFNLHHIRYLILYPTLLFYAVFAAITMF